MDEASISDWCCEKAAHPQELKSWRMSATQALAEPEEARASPLQPQSDRRRINELVHELRHKEKAFGLNRRTVDTL